jgi:hypothetical protein
MPRIRAVKPETFSDPDLARASIQARYLYIGLWTEADDEGRLLASTKRLVGALFPHDVKVNEAQVLRWLKELEGLRKVVRYEAGVGEYLYLPNFHRHQKISHKSPSKHPSPPPILPEPLGNGSGVTPEVLRPDREQGTGNREQGSASHIAKEPRRDLVFEAFCEVTGVNWHELSKDRRGQLNGMLASIRSRGGDDPDEIRARAEHWSFPVALTPETLTRRWAELGKARPIPDRNRDRASDTAARAAELEARGE